MCVCVCHWSKSVCLLSGCVLALTQWCQPDIFLCVTRHVFIFSIWAAPGWRCNIRTGPPLLLGPPFCLSSGSRLPKETLWEPSFRTRRGVERKSKTENIKQSFCHKRRLAAKTKTKMGDREELGRAERLHKINISVSSRNKGETKLRPIRVWSSSAV